MLSLCVRTPLPSRQRARTLHTSTHTPRTFVKAMIGGLANGLLDCIAIQNREAGQSEHCPQVKMIQFTNRVLTHIQRGQVQQVAETLECPQLSIRGRHIHIDILFSQTWSFTHTHTHTHTHTPYAHNYAQTTHMHRHIYAHTKIDRHTPQSECVGKPESMKTRGEER
jgi:hypothetical protein